MSDPFKKRRIAVVLVDRANYGRMRPVMTAVRAHPGLELKVVCTGSMLLERFGRAVDVVRKDGFDVDEEIYIEVEGSIPHTTAKTLGLAVIEFATAFNRLQPDIVLVIGDRFECLGAVLAASYQNFCIAHIQGGEVSYSNDEMCRHVITKMAHYHFPSTVRAGEFLERMGEDPKTIFVHGCPVNDVIRSMDLGLPPDFLKGRGLGADVDLSRDYFLAIFHPVATHPEKAQPEIKELLAALQEFKVPTIWLWANIDAGANAINKELRQYREYVDRTWLHMVKNFEPEEFQRVLAHARLAIGNSSSFVRDASIHGTPVVLVGDRQSGRETAPHVLPCPNVRRKDIAAAIKAQMGRGKFAPSDLYGTAGASEKIARTLSTVPIFHQKHLHYLYAQDPA